ncbi:hypothetical protein PQR63_01230 [Herbaspirillum rhizosphaerae]|uniref:Thymidylate kinase n=1 Tax=Herbaspirillum rhizosphaerae TaxID=346179 RepID=A0ABW8Z1K2_9BURK
MKFSEYVILEKPGLMMDPLGFIAPSANLQDTLFKQFTVLTNNPVYHGLLALVYQTLQRKGLIPGQPSFAFEFRKLEILWGLANAVQKEGVLNVTKYLPMVATVDNISLNNIPKSHGIYQRLAYGTLGHYSAPSYVWGLVEKGRSQLSDCGQQLADSFAERRGVSLVRSLEKWYEKNAVNKQELEELGQEYAISCDPESDEQETWRSIIRQYCRSTPHTSCYWDAPLTHDALADFNKSAQDYAMLFPTLRERYPTLESRFQQVQIFQLLMALTQYIFEREYLLLSEENFLLPPGEIEESLAVTLGRLAGEYISVPSHQDARGLFKSLAGVSSYRVAADLILRHHVRHQNLKNVSPFMENGRLLVLDRFHIADFTRLWEELDAAPDHDSALACLAYRYRRDWHFGRARTYYDYAGTKP